MREHVINDKEDHTKTSAVTKYVSREKTESKKKRANRIIFS